jgi:hypothetical protein
MLANGVARFAFTCERGTFEVDANLDGTGKLVGFTGRSPHVTPPESVAKFFAAALALHLNATWSEADYNRVFAKKQIPEAQVRGVAAGLRAQLGTCKLGAFSHEGLGWMVDLACTKGAPLVLSIQLDKQDQLESIQFHPPGGLERPRCPTR